MVYIDRKQHAKLPGEIALVLFVAAVSLGGMSCAPCMGKQAHFRRGSVRLTQRYDLDALAATVRARGECNASMFEGVLWIDRCRGMWGEEGMSAYAKLRNDGDGPTIVELFAGSWCEIRNAVVIKTAHTFLGSLPLSDADRRYLESQSLRLFVSRRSVWEWF